MDNITTPSTTEMTGFLQVAPAQPQSACPHCGYCPHCGRGGHHTYPFYPYYPNYPYYNPYYPTTVTCGGNAAAGNTIPWTNGNVSYTGKSGAM